MAAKTLFEKVWNEHVVHQEAGQPALLYIDLHLVHEVTSPQAFEGLRTAGRKLRAPHRTYATQDHNVPTTDRSLPIADRESALQVEALRKNCKEFGVRLFDLGAKRAGHRPCDWTRTGADPARDDDRMRRQPHLHARRVRRARVRYRHQRGGARAGDAMPVAGASAHDGNPGRRQAGAGRDRQGHHPGGDRAESAPTAPPVTWSSIAARRFPRFR